MLTSIAIQLRAFNVTIKDQRTGEVSRDLIVLDKQRLQAAQLVGESSKELIYRLYNREGYYVQNIEPAKKAEGVVWLDELYFDTAKAHEAGREVIE